MAHVLGLDCGIASVGWAILEIDDGHGKIIAAGTRMFDAPETDKERRPKSELRRMHRGQRRVIRRRLQRMNAVRSILHAEGLPASSMADALRYQGIDPWQARAAARERLLSPQELAIALGHIARHRGFKSNAKSRGNDPEGSKMKKAMAETQEKIAGRTFGEFVAALPGRKRNRDGDYARTPLRDDLAHEVRASFAAQRRLGSLAATPSLEQAFTEAAFFQRPLQDSETRGDVLVPWPSVNRPRYWSFARALAAYHVYVHTSALYFLLLQTPAALHSVAQEDLLQRFKSQFERASYLHAALQSDWCQPYADMDAKDFFAWAGAVLEALERVRGDYIPAMQTWSYSEIKAAEDARRAA